MNAVGIEPLSTFGLPPVEMINLAADTGCEHVALMMQGWSPEPSAYAPFTLTDAKLQQETKAALADRGIVVTLADGFLVRPDFDVSEHAEALEIMVGLGARLINTVSMDPDVNRSVDQFGRLAEMAAGAGIYTTIELSPGMTFADLPSTLRAVEQVGRSDFRLLVDTMHWGRSGATAADITALDPVLIGHVQLSDVPVAWRYDSYFEEAMLERMVPGTGEMQLDQVLAALPADVAIGLEVPQYSLVQAGMGITERLGRCVDATRELLRSIGRS